MIFIAHLWFSIFIAGERELEVGPRLFHVGFGWNRVDIGRDLRFRHSLTTSRTNRLLRGWGNLFHPR